MTAAEFAAALKHHGFRVVRAKIEDATGQCPGIRWTAVLRGRNRTLAKVIVEQRPRLRIPIVSTRDGPAGWTWRLGDEKPDRVSRSGRKAGDETSRPARRRAATRSASRRSGPRRRRERRSGWRESEPASPMSGGWRRRSSRRRRAFDASIRNRPISRKPSKIQRFQPRELSASKELFLVCSFQLRRATEATITRTTP
jgi:hypothetical protein